ncbi:MAG: hypothetical protein NVS3B28_14490 [Candidatus Velthaea sp.]
MFSVVQGMPSTGAFVELGLTSVEPVAPIGVVSPSVSMFGAEVELTTGAGAGDAAGAGEAVGLPEGTDVGDPTGAVEVEGDGVDVGDPDGAVDDVVPGGAGAGGFGDDEPPPPPPQPVVRNARPTKSSKGRNECIMDLRYPNDPGLARPILEQQA